MINIYLAAFKDATNKVFSEGKKLINSLIGEHWQTTEEKPFQFIWFLTGGSERAVIEKLNNAKFVVLVGNQEGNAYAAASEVKSYLKTIGVASVLLESSDEDDILMIQKYVNVFTALHKLQGKQLGLIGTVSDWLVNSTVTPEKMVQVFGIDFHQFLWDELPEYKQQNTNPEFLQHFPDSVINLNETSQVYTLINNWISKKGLDAITVECFSLVKKHAVTACLPLSFLNDQKIPAGCEGDICSILSKMLVTELVGFVPWMANLVAVNKQSVYFAHCTIPLSQVTAHTITTHYETGLGTAIKGIWKKKNVTIFRLNNTLTKAFISSGEILDNLSMAEACRTQIEVQLPTIDLKKLKDNPLGNHHIIIAGEWQTELQMFCKIKNIQIV